MKQVTGEWLATLCPMIQDVIHAAVYAAGEETTPLALLASWPEQNTPSQVFIPVVKAALAKGQCVLLHQNSKDTETGEPDDIIARPLLLDDQMYGVVVLQISSSTDSKRQAALQLIETAARWFSCLVNQSASIKKKQLTAILELVAVCLEQERFTDAACEVATELAAGLSCNRVSIGFLSGHRVKVAAVSENTGFNRKTALIRHIGEAMHEAMEQDSSIVHPQAEESVLLACQHDVLAGNHGCGSILTIPFGVQGRMMGAVLFERPLDRSFDRETQEYFAHIVSIIGPVLNIRQREEQLLPARLYQSGKQALGRILGRGHMALKLGLLTAFLCLLLPALISGQYRVTGNARLEAMIQRVVISPRDGYIAKVNVRPGDLIKHGDVLGELDDRDLQLEGRKWSSRRQQLQSEYRDALARYDRSKLGVLKAKIIQAEAQLNLVREQLARSTLLAPFDGLVVSGDLSQSLGSPVERGQVLFTVAPLESYRIIIQVDERDINRVKKGLYGRLVLSGITGQPLAFTIKKVTPVSKIVDGRNVFLVEAQLEKISQKQVKLLRPGMEGIAKINIDHRKLLWIWTHGLVGWLRLKLWAWNPIQ
ncbi:MAG TPA: HlyD family efflux transporter periplasmic adaptor subunit [Desulfobulbus sp.]|nr:HlyD family efflux transporter periplasmic adaptor subunit [Desulfobulbus sp.]